MEFTETYLGRIRGIVGGRLLLVPGAGCVVEDGERRIVLGRRADMREWSMPTGGAEEGGSFAKTAVDEVAEETGLTVREQDLVAYGCFSDNHVVTYPNGDVTHWFTVCFVAKRWTGTPAADMAETIETGFFSLDDLPSPLQASTAAMIELYRRFTATGEFQIS